jgi:cytochrome c553
MRVGALLVLFFLSPWLQASEEALQRFNQLRGDPALNAQAYERGHLRIQFCGNCHGEDGNSKRSYIPNLAEQNPVYLFNAFEQFASGAREDYVMSKLAPILTLEDRVNIALYYSQQKLKAPEETSEPELRQAGEAIFSRICYTCHGKTAEGQEKYPRLAGQPSEYLRKSLTRFRNKDPSRSGSLMFAIMNGYSDQDIQALAAFLHGLGN